MSERCSDLSRAVGESLAATATAAESWLLVEVRSGWSRDVGKSEALSPVARAVVDAWLDVTPRSRLLFIRRPARTSGTSLAFVVHAPESGGVVRRIELEELDDLADADLERGGTVSDVRLVLVCGHGSRDPCCALRGTAVFGALAPALGEEELWLSSHQGGHRFAANVVVLPAAIQLGRVEPGDAPSVVGAALEGRISLEHYRGRTCHGSAVQAAEHAVRAAEGLDRVGDLELTGVSGETVRFRGANGREFVADVTEVAGPNICVSCGTEPEPQTAYAVALR